MDLKSCIRKTTPGSVKNSRIQGKAKIVYGKKGKTLVVYVTLKVLASMNNPVWWCNFWSHLAMLDSKFKMLISVRQIFKIFSFLQWISCQQRTGQVMVGSSAWHQSCSFSYWVLVCLFVVVLVWGRGVVWLIDFCILRKLLGHSLPNGGERSQYLFPDVILSVPTAWCREG